MKRILLVDDDEEICEEIADLLKEERYLVRTAFDGEKALQILEKEAFDLVILDLKLPVVSGLEVLRTLKSRSVPFKILVTTGRPMFRSEDNRIPVFDKKEDTEGKEILRLADAFMNKPFDVVALLKKLKDMLG
jgi:DNA-binding response OmpR family regulator